MVSLSVQDDNVEKLEDFLRNTAVFLGGVLGVSLYPFSKQQITDHCIHNSISRCWRLGYEILKARKERSDPFKAIEKEENAKLIFKGKIVQFYKKFYKCWNMGTYVVEGFDEFKDTQLIINY